MSSFFKKMTKEFEELKATFLKDDDDRKEAKPEVREQGRDSTPQHGQPSNSYPQQYKQSARYGGGPPSGPPPGPPGAGSLPPGWVTQWDQHSQRWYFLEQGTGRSQWEPPYSFAPSHGGYGAHPQTVGQYDQYSASNQGGYGGYPPSVGQYDQRNIANQAEDKGHGSGMGAAAGGLAVGAVGGALIGHALGNDSDSESGRAPAPLQGYNQQAYGQPPPFQNSAGLPLTGALPDETASGSSVSSSDKEDVAEARKDYREALEDGDKSDIEEAKEDYEEQYEKTYDSD